MKALIATRGTDGLRHLVFEESNDPTFMECMGVGYFTVFLCTTPDWEYKRRGWLGSRPGPGSEVRRGV